MKLEVLRFNSSDDFTNGILFDVSNNKREFLAIYLRRSRTNNKSMGMRQRSHQSKYNLSLRKMALHIFTRRNLASLSGMIHVDNVNGFKYINYQRISNDDDDTASYLTRKNFTR